MTIFGQDAFPVEGPGVVQNGIQAAGPSEHTVGELSYLGQPGKIGH
jgi:hypothetical protein